VIRRALPLALGLLLVVVPLAGAAAPTMEWRLVAERPHDPTAFTEGLVADGPVLLESTGLYGASDVRRVDPRTGAVLARRALAPSLFGEGLTVLGGRAYQLTWNEHRLLGYDPAALAPVRDAAYPFVGWGLTTDGTSLIAGDGTATVRWLDPATLKVRRSIRVHDGVRAVTQVNELELRGGLLWANIWHADRVALIDPRDGRVRAWLDLAPLRARLPTPGEVLNGIARDPVTGRTAVTGKNWSRLFVIRLTGRRAR
jgi:glutamine cyclotransferase